MDEMDSITTMDALRLFGFLPDSDVMSDGCTGMSYDLGGFKLTAGQFLNLQLREVVSIIGMYRTNNSLGMIEFDMPRHVESNEQCAAWIAWHINQQLPRQARIARRHLAAWLTMGMQNQATLPWVRKMAAYRARPVCEVRRQWLRLALKQLSSLLAATSDEETVEVGFDGTVLIFRSIGEIVPIGAKGSPWPDRYVVAAQRFRKPPGRMMMESVELSIWEDRLTIGARGYGNILASKPTGEPVTMPGSRENGSHRIDESTGDQVEMEFTIDKNGRRPSFGPDPSDLAEQ